MNNSMPVELDDDNEGENEHQFTTVDAPEEGKKSGFKIKIKPMARSVTDEVARSYGLRRSTRTRKSSESYNGPSGSEYSVGNASTSGSRGDENEYMDGANQEEEDGVEVAQYTTSRGRTTKIKNSYAESEASDMDLFRSDDNVTMASNRRNLRNAQSRGNQHNTIFSDGEGSATIEKRYSTRSSTRKQGASTESVSPPAEDLNGTAEHSTRLTRSRASRLNRKSARQLKEEEGYEDGEDADAIGSSDEEMEIVQTTPEPEQEIEEETNGRPYSLRTRTKQINYAIPPPLEETAPTKGSSRPNKGKGRQGPGWSATGAELSRYFDESDSDYPTRTPRKPFGAGAGGGLFAAGGAGLFPNDLAAAAGTPSNLGKVTDSALADADPLGVNTNVTFDEIGGLDDHINSLKEMTLLPLLYPEVFQRFNLTPPRGVLFHGPPGTGKTLLARALAASCRSDGRSIAFFMRKGADCLSKWVGEAERQLRLLFDEARNSQPSIIFFDEIDGLAPVRSSKQDQIHASIVSTLLALMDGMDGRGQVIVIGATNRPDAVDPALRRPGRFDREFYFPLPNLDARAKILSIITRKWEGWQDEKAEQTIQRLAKLTKGYGGADLRALCTEAALNAVHRRYPQIYKTNDRLLLKPETINVQARDFMISVKNIIPSSARSVGSSASPLPTQLVPLLDDKLEEVKEVLSKALPVGKKRTALEEAEWEDEGEEGALEREVMLQAMETLRVYRPRVLLHGPSGMGQNYLGAAALHHLEGFHVQTLDIGNLVGDSTRTVEAAIVQLFVEAKRHQPSVVFVPNLYSWSFAVSESARSTVRAMLDSLSPSDPILLLAVVDSPFFSLPRDIRSWFGATKENRVQFSQPNAEKRRNFFKELLVDIRRPPNQFPDGVKRKKRVLEQLPIAPPLEPRQPTPAELALQEENDRKIISILKYRLGPILTELKRKFKRFTKPAADEYSIGLQFVYAPLAQPIPLPVENHINGIINVDAPPIEEQNNLVNGQTPATEVQVVEVPQVPKKLHMIDLERMHVDLYKEKYLTPDDFLDDIGKIVQNAEIRKEDDRDRLFKAQAMYTAAEVSIQEFDPQFRLECERMADRERKRREQRREAKEKLKAAAGDQAASGDEVYAPGTRRSGRNNGQQPEISITDPVAIERRLKRSRSKEANGDSRGSEDERVDGRSMKRIRTDDEREAESNDDDPLDMVGPNSSQLQVPAHHAVRFVTDFEATPPRTPGPSGLNVLMPIIEEGRSEPRVLSTGGFDPHLLNPMPNIEPFPPSQSHAISMMDPQLNGQWTSDIVPVSPAPIETSTLAQSTEPATEIDVHLPPTIQPSLNSTSAPGTPRRSPIPTVHVEQAETDVNQVPQSASDMDVTVPRTPSPPLPDFHVDDNLVASLETKFVDRTGNLNVEQLEQLRALSLSCIWRHRQDWDRDSTVHELFTTIDDFVREVGEDANDFDEMS